MTRPDHLFSSRYIAVLFQNWGEVFEGNKGFAVVLILFGLYFLKLNYFSSESEFLIRPVSLASVQERSKQTGSSYVLLLSGGAVCLLMLVCFSLFVIKPGSSQPSKKRVYTCDADPVSHPSEDPSGHFLHADHQTPSPVVVPVQTTDIESTVTEEELEEIKKFTEKNGMPSGFGSKKPKKDPSYYEAVCSGPAGGNSGAVIGIGGIGQKLLYKMGFEGGGLGISGQGITQPIQAEKKKDRAGIGFPKEKEEREERKNERKKRDPSF